MDIEDLRNQWVVQKAHNGLIYYFNKNTKKSTWYKPECFQTKKERANLTDWKELHTSEGRKYYYNITTKETTWIMPAQLKEIIERMVIFPS